jgi:DNA-binding LacI/PurR family transcriptional regulator
LIACGHKKIGILAGFQRLSTMRERLAGFRQALQDHNIALPEEWVVESPLGIEPGCEAALKILSLSNRPSALFVNNNLLVLGVLLAIQQLGLHCPEDISLVGFDDHPWSAVSNPPLTVVKQPSRRLGQVAAETMLSLINDNRPLEKSIILDCELIIRKSCCIIHS